jgi:hypothetical protein
MKQRLQKEDNAIVVVAAIPNLCWLSILFSACGPHHFQFVACRHCHGSFVIRHARPSIICLFVYQCSSTSLTSKTRDKISCHQSKRFERVRRNQAVPWSRRVDRHPNVIDTDNQTKVASILSNEHIQRN